MASVGISSRGGQLGGVGGGGAANTFYYCFECESTLTITATSDSDVVCPNCDSAVLEEFETPSSSPPPPPPPRPTTVIDLQSFFPTSDTDSDVELSDALPPPAPPPPSFFHDDATMFSRARNYLSNLHIHSLPRPRPPPPPPLRSSSDFFDSLDSEFRHPRPPSPPPSVAVINRRPQFPVPSAPTIDYLFFPSPEENDTNQYSHFDTELDFAPPPPPPPLSPSSSRDHWDYFFPLSTESDEDIQPRTSSIQSPPPRPQPTPSSQLSSRDNLNHPRALELQPPPPPPWLLPLSAKGLLDMKMTEKLVSEWECHQCAICIDNFEMNQMVKLMPCRHLYHSVCILPWLDVHKSCPVCRSKLPSH